MGRAEGASIRIMDFMIIVTEIGQSKKKENKKTHIFIARILVPVMDTRGGDGHFKKFQS